jgi:TPR repeat protein
MPRVALRSLQFGRGVDRDDVRALALWHEAAEEGFSEAQYLLGRLYFVSSPLPCGEVLSGADLLPLFLSL